MPRSIPSNANGTLFTFTANYQGGGGFAASNSANHDDDDSIESNTPPKVTITSVAGTPSGIQISGNTSSSLYLGSPQLALLINNKPEPCYPLIQPEQGSGSNYTFTITLSDPALTAGTYTFVVVSKGQLYEYPASYSAPYTVTLPL